MTIKMPSAKLVSVDRRAAEFISRAGADQPSPAVDETAKKTVVNMRLDTELLRRIDAAAKRQGITRTAWLSVAALGCSMNDLSAPRKRDAISRFLTGNSGSEGLDRGNPCIAGTGRKCHICPMARTKENLKAAPAKIVSEHLGVSADTLRRWGARGLINATITAGGHYRYNLQEYLEAVEEAVRRAK